MNFWNVVKEVSPHGVRKEAERPFVLTLAGEPDQVAAARAKVLGGGLTPAEIAAAEPFLCSGSPPFPEELEMRMRHSDLLILLHWSFRLSTVAKSTLGTGGPSPHPKLSSAQLSHPDLFIFPFLLTTSFS